MAKIVVKEGSAGQAQTATPQADTFVFTTKRGDEIVGGKPRGVLKLKLRNILEREELEKDAELTQIATAILSIRSINGEQPKCSTRLQFETIIQNNFGDDSDLDAFMNAYQKHTNPEYSEYIEECLKEAAELGLVDPDDLKAFMTKKLLERQALDQEKVRLS